MRELRVSRAAVSRAAALSLFSLALSPCKLPAHAHSDEPAALHLLQLCEGRRPSSWRGAERPGVDALIDEVVALQAPWKGDALRGKWRLAYLQPGPDGAGVDRRIPFPELPWNDSFQIFGTDSVTNVGELAGPLLSVQVRGSLIEEDPSDLQAPKRFRALINEGGLCIPSSLCVPLPIRGEGIFDGLYLGSRLRIGQNINGGGARIVQVRVD
uniref:Plastid lipid-associated protein/fibrillin conserved domain-containing protein n=1 Tax=Coccolithus braarudii TaxID=221442 RepID=A0A7S0LEV3_9EUKA|mmetsp:Transcript_36199/g.77197  ORF Transcript_36199/g.77197 Transcript_36199/m.77197 type:complete len:212 (+) Transcript_36199:69-704(+)